MFRRLPIPVTRDYELMWLLGADADDEIGTASVERISSFVTGKGGEMVSAEPWGRRTLAYDIEKNSEGSYFLAFFKLDSASTPELEQTLDADQEVIRHLLIRHDKPVPETPDADEPEDRRDRGRRPRRP